MLAKAACPIVDCRSPLTSSTAAKDSRLRRVALPDHGPTGRRAPQLIVVESSRLYGADGTGAWLPGFKTFNPAWINSLTPLMRQLRDTGAQVLMLGPIPDPMESVPICLSAHLDDATACAASPELLSKPGIAAEAQAVKAGGANTPTSPNCSAPRPAAVRGREHHGVLRHAPDPGIFRAVGAGYGRAGRPGARPRFDLTR